MLCIWIKLTDIGIVEGVGRFGLEHFLHQHLPHHRWNIYDDLRRNFFLIVIPAWCFDDYLQ